ncbi:MAG TPA: PDZ domain-containing protein, partial [Gemmatimonadales bacterium]
LGLKGGDVILSVDGRKASGPSSLLRILRSYEPGDSFKLEIMRNKSRTTVTGKLEKPKDE